MLFHNLCEIHNIAAEEYFAVVIRIKLHTSGDKKVYYIVLKVCQSLYQCSKLHTVIDVS